MNSINTNGAALKALQALNGASKTLTQDQLRVSTGLAVASARDDGATWSIAQNMRVQASSWETIAAGLGRAQSIADVAATSASDIATMLGALKTDALKLNDPTLDADSQNDVRQEMQQLLNQVDMAANSATFDGVNLLVPVTDPAIPLSYPPGGPTANMAFSTSLPGIPGEISLWGEFYNVSPNAPPPSVSIATTDGTTTAQMGAASPAGSTSLFSLSVPYGDWNDFGATNPSSANINIATSRYAPPSPASYGATIQGLTLTPFRTHESVQTSPGGDTNPLLYQPMTSQWLGLSNLTSYPPDQMMITVDNAIDQANKKAAYFGSQQNLLAGQIRQAGAMQDALTTGVGNLVDADMGKASAALQADQVKQQLAAKALSIANAAPQWILSLFR